MAHRETSRLRASPLSWSSPSPVSCIVKQRLFDSYIAAVAEVNRVSSAQILALRNGEGLLFEVQLAKALEWRENAKFAMIAHSEQHGCGE
jgi:hypothetical protein